MVGANFEPIKMCWKKGGELVWGQVKAGANPLWLMTVMTCMSWIMGNQPRM